MARRSQRDRRAVEVEVEHARRELLEHIIALTNGPMIVLSFVWVALLIVDYTSGLPPLGQTISNVIWALFVLQFVVELVVAPRKLEYLKTHWLTALSLVLPAFRALRIVRALRVLRAASVAGSFSLLRLLTAMNRGMVALRSAVGHRRVGYIAALTLVVTLAGAAGMFYFENPAALRQAGHVAEVEGGAGLHSYEEAVWWTAMIMTTMGSAYWPVTIEGRILCWILALYAFGVFGYITATIASYFVGRDAATGAGQDDSEGTDQPAQSDATDGGQVEVMALRGELAALRAQMSALLTRLDGQDAPSLRR